MRKNTKIKRFPRFLGKFHACANGGNQAFFPPSVNAGYEAILIKVHKQESHGKKLHFTSPSIYYK